MAAGAGPDITSTANPRVKHLVALRRRRTRDDAGVTLVEGRAELELALASGVRPRALYYCADLTGSAAGLAGLVAGLGGEVISVSEQVFAKIAYRESPDGWLAVVPAIGGGVGALGQAALAGRSPGGQPLVVVCQGVEKPGNLGAILRTADAAGVAAVIATDPATDWGNPNVVRASKGTVFSVPVASGSTAEVMAWLTAMRLTVVAATPAARTLVTEADLRGPVAIAVGAEDQGLPPEWIGRADIAVRIPMFGRADSLNVSTSAAILCYEAVRQRLGS